MGEATRTATFVRGVGDHRVDARLYRLDVPLEGNVHVVVSAIGAAYDTGRPETYIFGADEDGVVVSWRELPGSFQGGMDHAKALADAGYEIADVLVVQETGTRKAVEA